MFAWKRIADGEIIPGHTAPTRDALFEAAGFGAVDTDKPLKGFLAVPVEERNGQFIETDDSNQEAEPMTYTTNITSLPDIIDGHAIGDKLGEERFYHAFQALKSQAQMAHHEECEDPSAMRMSMYRRTAMKEWSWAVRNGFVCC